MASQLPKVDKRTERSKALVIAGTYRQLSQSGLANVSIDEISRVSGVSKTTIYRHWPSRSALLIDACSRLGGAAAVPDTGSLRGDLHMLLSALAEQLQTASWSAVVPSIVDAAERDGDVRAMQIGWHKGLMSPFSAVVEQAKTRGEILAHADPHAMIAMTAGALFYRRWFSRESIDIQFVDVIVSAAVAVIAR
jgi:AcrR family transcriptional regulator